MPSTWSRVTEAISNVATASAATFESVSDLSRTVPTEPSWVVEGIYQHPTYDEIPDPIPQDEPIPIVETAARDYGESVFAREYDSTFRRTGNCWCGCTEADHYNDGDRKCSNCKCSVYNPKF